MFIDARRLDDASSIEAEVCVIGGGVGGITLALEFEKRRIRTCLIESGGFAADEATRDLYRGESIGLPYLFADGCRSGFLGGSSNCWGGWCRPLDGRTSCGARGCRKAAGHSKNRSSSPITNGASASL